MALLSKLDICSQAGLLLHAPRGIVYLFTVEYIGLPDAVIRPIAPHVVYSRGYPTQLDSFVSVTYGGNFYLRSCRISRNSRRDR
jgi:hypothetical protein